MGILSSITVLDLTRNVAGPYCTQILADLGADVIKVEHPEGGDDTREWAPPYWDDESTMFMSFNRNKRSIAVDLNRQRGQSIIRELASRADVVVESFRPGSLAKRGLDYESLKQDNDPLVFCSLTGFGERGPLKDKAGYDPLIQAYSGIMSLTGEPGRPPVRVGTSIIDMGTGMWSALAILSALLERQETGRGQKVRTSLFEVGTAWLPYQLAGYLGNGQVPEKWGNRTSMIAPYEAFKTADDYIVVSAPNNDFFRRLCSILERTELPTDPRFETNPKRVANRDALHDLLEERFRTQPTDHWLKRLEAEGLACSKIQRLDEVVEDDQLQALGMLRSVPHPRLDDLQLVDLPVELDGKRAEIRRGPPDLGEHTVAVLESLGYDDSTIQRLTEDGVIRSCR